MCKTKTTIPTTKYKKKNRKSKIKKNWVEVSPGEMLVEAAAVAFCFSVFFILFFLFFFIVFFRKKINKLQDFPIWFLITF